VEMFFYLANQQGISQSYCALLASLCLCFSNIPLNLAIPITIYYRQISSLIQERKMLVLMVFLCLVSTIFLTGFITSTEIVYEIFLALLIILNCLLESTKLLL
jgi:hypothetical protein